MEPEPAFFEFTDVNDVHRYIRLDEVVEVRLPTGRVHDNGAVRLRGVGWISFRSGSTADHLLKVLKVLPR